MSPTMLTLTQWILPIICASIAAFIAQRKKANPYLWFAIGFIFGILGIFAVFFIPTKTKSKLASLPPEPAPRPEPVLRGPKDKFWYYVDKSKTQQGPVSFQAVQQFFKEGTISANTFVWHEDLSEWTQLENLLTNYNPN
jgi:hypothetical protein